MIRTVYTPGCWDLLHVGHLRYLQQARTYGAQDGQLIVGVASDRVVAEDKGEPPIVGEDERAELLLGLGVVDAVSIYRELNFIDELKFYRPQVLVWSDSWKIAERHQAAFRWMERNGGKCVCIPYDHTVSTTAIQDEILDRYRAQFDLPGGDA